MLKIVVCLLFGATLGACSRRDKTSDDTDIATQIRAESQVAEVKAVQEAEAARKSREGVVERTSKQSASMSNAERTGWIRHCILKAGCKDWQIQAIVDGSPPTERTRADRAMLSAQTERLAGTATDGEKVSGLIVGEIASAVGNSAGGFPLIDQLQKTSIAEAKKDPSGSRGKSLRMSGRVQEIRKSQEYFEGAIVLEDMTIVRFFTNMSTNSIFDGTYAKFIGVFIQEYDYANVSGGQTRSLLVVGAFDIPDNRTADR